MLSGTRVPQLPLGDIAKSHRYSAIVLFLSPLALYF